MAIVKDNILTEGFSGRIGNIVFRSCKGNHTIVAKKPHKSTVVSDGMEEQRTMFAKAVSWAKLNQSKPEYVEAAAASKRCVSPFNMALRAAIKNPALMED